MMTEVATTLAGARKGRPSILRRWVGQALARNLSCLVVPGPEVALAHGLNLAAADMRIAATPRDATVLLVVGELSQKLDEATAVLYAQMPRPRAILVLGGSEPSSLPKADVSADLSQTELMEAATRLQRLLAEDAFAASPDDFDSSILQTKTEYVCPMHPEVVEDEPGSCPKCGMDLVAREAGGDADAGEHDHSGHGHGDHDHGDHDHGSSGFMSMVEVTKDLPRSADGLAMDWLEVPFGPCFPGLPGGLRLTLTLDGDGVTEGQATSLVAMGTPSEEVAVETFIERLAAATPLAPVSYRLLACRAIEQAAGLEPDPAVERGRAAALERERIASHLGWLAQLGRQLSFVWLTRRAAALQLETQRADGEQLVVLRPALQALIARLEHTPLLKARLKGIGALPHGSQDLRGPVARASGRTEDARQADAMYCELGFELYIEGAGDAWARFRQRHVEIVTSLDLVEAAGDPELPKLRAIDSPSGTGEATVETPRGRSTLQLTLERGQVVSVELDGACRQHIGLAADLVEGQELGDALVAVGSLDLSPWEVSS
ncbi:heavy metal-binding domain-containing protein [Alloalcanivorax venustensis]|jgi:Ni,Fe-hydrogenase III large subunit|uniref:Ni Fe-hydrogenase III large subunit-like protein n=3 Tax=Alloalcanivorax venustensis TaxID=172371 RepID=A0ABS0ABJ1_9GAMM|nr:Ni Fe-hydrogenase III large subunit-like protein [Alloalcanivorax venustensis ISO4]MEA3261417.1 heavy metal-binding domain-containing protein [Pseudomonadota bacterium]|tara:strand:- start:2183 stop:3826 length:1644 start_codon:yes stop_codon:yes gene_type:complete